MAVLRLAGADRAARASVIVAGAVIASAVLLAVGLFAGAYLGNDAGDSAPGEGSVDVGFSRDMREHHAQAVEMSVMVREATDDPAVRALALDILLTQQQQVGQMYGWLAAWGVPQTSSSRPMSWMPPADDRDEGADGMADQDHGSMSMENDGPARMPGMASEAQLNELARARGERAERIYLQLMIPHHQAGVTMAEYASERATEPQVRRLAQRIVSSQRAEIKVLTSMLDSRGGPVGGV